MTPRSTVAATIQVQSGAAQIITGIGSATTQPKASTRLRPIRSDQRPATKFITAFTAPKATTKDASSRNDPRSSPNSLSASAGTTVRVMPMAKPTSITWIS